MNGSDLLDAMEHVDEELIEKAAAMPEGRLRRFAWYTVAACLALFLLVAGTMHIGRTTNPAQIPTGESTVTQPGETEEPEEVYYNRVDTARIMVDPIVHYLYHEELTKEELAQFLPEVTENWMDFSGSAQFHGDGTLTKVILTVKDAEHGMEYRVTIWKSTYSQEEAFGEPNEDGYYSAYTGGNYYLIPEDARQSTLGNRSFTIYQSQNRSMGCERVWTEYQVDGLTYWISADIALSFLTEGKGYFEDLVACYGKTNTVPDLTLVKPGIVYPFYRGSEEIYYNQVDYPAQTEPAEALSQVELDPKKQSALYPGKHNSWVDVHGHALYRLADGGQYGVQLEVMTQYWDKPVRVLMRQTPEDVFLGATAKAGKLVRSTYVFFEERGIFCAYRADTEDGIKLWIEFAEGGIFYNFSTTVETTAELHKAKSALETMVDAYVDSGTMPGLSKVLNQHQPNG